MNVQRTRAHRRAEIRAKLGIVPAVRPAPGAPLGGRRHGPDVVARLGIEVHPQTTQRGRRPASRALLEPPGGE